MNKARRLLVNAAQKFDLPSDVIAGAPRIEILGTSEFALERHAGLLEYSKERITILTSMGPVSVTGELMQIKQMGKSRIVITGRLSQLCLPEEPIE